MKNKFVKLPLFLGIVVAVCGGLLALVYSFTNPIIERQEKEKAYAAYVEMYKEFNVTAENFEVSEDVENISGCSAVAYVKTDSVKGACYTVTTKGFGGEIKFQIAFANGKYLSYNDISNSETAAYGGIVIGGMAEKVNGIDASTKLLDNSDYSSFISGKSVTGKALANAIENCRADYLSWYNK